MPAPRGELATVRGAAAAGALTVVSSRSSRPVLWDLACDGADGVRGLLTGITGDLAHAMALAGARTLTGIPVVTGPTTAHSLET